MQSCWNARMRRKAYEGEGKEGSRLKSSKVHQRCGRQGVGEKGPY